MASSSKKKTTFAKLNREAALREKRVIKEARKAARKQAAASASPARPGETPAPEAP
jgi:hypothetical protein